MVTYDCIKIYALPAAIGRDGITLLADDDPKAAAIVKRYAKEPVAMTDRVAELHRLIASNCAGLSDYAELERLQGGSAELDELAERAGGAGPVDLVGMKARIRTLEAELARSAASAQELEIKNLRQRMANLREDHAEYLSPAAEPARHDANVVNMRSAAAVKKLNEHAESRMHLHGGNFTRAWREAMDMHPDLALDYQEAGRLNSDATRLSDLVERVVELQRVLRGALMQRIGALEDKRRKAAATAWSLRARIEPLGSRAQELLDLAIQVQGQIRWPHSAAQDRLVAQAEGAVASLIAEVESLEATVAKAEANAVTVAQRAGAA